MTDFFHSTEFLVVLLVVAAAVIALFAMPQSRGEVTTHLLEGRLSASLEGGPDRVEVSCDGNGVVVLRRRGLRDLGESATVALAITKKGFDLEIEERITPGRRADFPIDTAEFTLDFLAPERYHVKYNSDALSTYVAFTLNNRPGFRASKPFYIQTDA